LYSDFFNNLDPHPLSDDLAVKINEASVRQSIKNLILTDSGERRFQPELGGNIRKMLFENFTPQTVVSVKQRIESLINEREPRASLRDVIITSQEDNNAIIINIIFSVVNRQEPISMDVILERVR
jgi:phage baseplate assembly protein W